MVGMCNTDLPAAGLAGQAKAAMVTAMGREGLWVQGSGLPEACVLRLAWASETHRQCWKGEPFRDPGWCLEEIEASGPSQGGASASLSPQLFGSWGS